MEELEISNRQIAMMAFNEFHKENRKGSVLRLVRCLLQGTSTSLDIGDIDWDVDTATRQCGGEPSTGYRYTAYFHFNRKAKVVKERYDEVVRELYE